jgi:hypothetical protein
MVAFSIEHDSTMTKVPGMSGSPPNTTKGEAVRPPNTAGRMNTSMGPKGSGGGSSSAGPNGTTNGPAGQEIKGFVGSPPAVGGKSWKKARDMSNPMKR